MAQCRHSPLVHAAPTCGRSIQSARKPKIVVLPERDELDRLFLSRGITKDHYYRECKAIGLRDDLRFLVKVAGENMTGDVLVDALSLMSELETRKSTTADAKAINALRDRYRVSKGSLVVVAGSPESLRLAAERARWSEAA